MRFLAITLLVAVTTAKTTETPSIPCNPGVELTYSYVGEAYQEIPGTSEDGSGVVTSMTFGVKMLDESNLLEMKIKTCSISSYLLTAAKNLNSKLCADLMTYSLPFQLQNGHIYGVFPNTMEREDILNVKRGILSAMQVSIVGKDNIWEVEEVDVLGHCWTEVRELHTEGNVIVLKNRDTTKCRGCKCSSGTAVTFTPSVDQEAKFAYGQMSADYKLNKEGNIISANVTQYHELAPLSKEAGRVVSVINQKLVLLEKLPLQCGEQVDITLLPNTSLKFDCQAKAAELIPIDFYTKAVAIIEELSAALPHDIPVMFMELINHMRQLSKRELYSLKTMYFSPRQREYFGSKPDKILFHEKIAKKHAFFVDALMFVGTEPAVEMIVDMADSSSLLSWTQKLEYTFSLAATPLKYIDPCKLLDYTLTLASRNYQNRTATLVLGTVLDRVHSNCAKDCKVETDKAVQFLLEKMQQSIDELPEDFDLHDPSMKENVKKFKLAIHAIKAIKNSRMPKAISFLKDAVLTKKLLVDGRVEALYALKEISVRAPVMVREFALDIYMQKTEDEELRIAAFNTFMHTINSRYTFPLDLMLKLKRSMLTEQNENVKSYVCSYANNLKRTEDPSLRKRRDAIFSVWMSSGAFLTCKSADKSFSKSKSTRGYVSLADLPTTRPLPRDVMGAGVTVTSVFNDASNIPRASALKVKASMFGFDFELLETGFRAAGMEELIRHVFGPTGYLRKGTRRSDISGLPRNDDFAYDLPLENMSASGYLKVLGQELLWEQIEQDEIMELLYNQPKINKLRKLVTDAMLDQFTYDSVYDKTVKFIDYLRKGEYSLWKGKFNFTKTVSFLDFNKVIPTIIGMPLTLKAKATGHVQLHAASYATYRNERPFVDAVPSFLKKFLGLESKSQVNVYGDISPKLSIGMGVEVVLDAYDYKPKLVFFANATSNFTQRAFAKIFPNFTTSVEVYEMPEDEVMLLNASYTQYAEVDGKYILLGINKRNKTQVFKPVGAQFVGIDVFSNISYPNTSMVSMAPLFPLSGPANFNLLLKCVDKDLTMLKFTAWNETEMTMDNGEFKTKLNGLGLEKWINASLIWKTNETKMMFNFSTWSLPANATGLFNISLDDFNKISGFEGDLSINTTFSNFTGYTKVNRTFFYTTAFHKRYFDDKVNALVTVPDYWVMLHGSLKQKNYVKLMAKAYVEGWRKEHFIFTSGAVDGMNVNVSVESSLFRLPEMKFLNVDKINGSYMSPFPVFNPVCHLFNDHVVMFDGLKYSYKLSPECEYVLARHRHLNDTFGITILDKAVKVFINGTVYELRPDSTQLKVNNQWKALPYQVKHVVKVQKVRNDNEQYIYLRAFAGIEIYYNMGDVVISVDRFYSSQTAGLCGNSNSVGTYVDEIRLPSLQMAQSLEDFTESWILANSECKSHPKNELFPSVDPEAVKQCSKLFDEVLAEAKDVVPLGPFYNACIHEVSLKRDPMPIVKAYVLAAKTQSLSLKACEWKPWSAWSRCVPVSCEWKPGSAWKPWSGWKPWSAWSAWSAWSGCSGRKSRTRQVSKSYLGNICLSEEGSKGCETGPMDVKLDLGCSVLSKRLRMKFEDHTCKTDRKYEICNDACEAVYSEVPEHITMRCFDGKNPSEEQLKNSAVFTVPYNKVVECRKTLQ